MRRGACTAVRAAGRGVRSGRSLDLRTAVAVICVGARGGWVAAPYDYVVAVRRASFGGAQRAAPPTQT